jgi:hypothetical protein
LLEHICRNRIRVADIVKHDRERDFRCQRWVEPSVDELSNWEFWEPDTSKRKSLLTVDVDERYDQELLESFGVAPNWISLNRLNGHAQITWYLDESVFGWKIAEFRSVAQIVTRVLNGDPYFSHGLRRNVLARKGAYEHHHQHDSTHSLKNLADAAREMLSSGPRFEPVSESARDLRQSKARMVPEIPKDHIGDDGFLMRRQLIFDLTRAVAYRSRDADGKVSEHTVRGIADEMHAEILERMRSRGDDRGPIREADVRSTVKSITWFINETMKPASGGRELTLEDRIRMGSKRGRLNVLNGTLRAAQERGRRAQVERSEMRAAKAQSLRKLGHTITEIAELLGVAIRTVYRFLRMRVSEALMTDRIPGQWLKRKTSTPKGDIRMLGQRGDPPSRRSARSSRANQLNQLRPGARRVWLSRVRI